MPNDDDITSGTCKNCAIADVNDVQDETVFARQSMGQPFTQVRSTYWADLTTDWYSCGVPIGSTVSAGDSSANSSNLANALTALQDALKVLVSKLR